MKAKSLFLFLLLQTISFAQPLWRPMGDEDFNRPTCGYAKLVGRHPVAVKNGHIYVFNMETETYGTPNMVKMHFSVGRFNGAWWDQHMDFPVLFPYADNPIIDCALDSNEIPYVVYNDITTGNQPAVKKFENGSWVAVGSGISASSSTFFNLEMGSDNLPRLLYREGNTIMLKRFDGTNWVTISATTEFMPYTSIALSLDRNNVPYVVTNYVVGSTANCFVKKFNGTSWEEVGITGFSDYGGVLVFDLLNVPYMVLGYAIKKFDGTTWQNLASPLQIPGSGIGVVIYDLFFDNSNNLFAYNWRTYGGGLPSAVLSKLVGTTWQHLSSNYAIQHQNNFVVSGNDAYYIKSGDGYFPVVNKIINGQNAGIGGSTFRSYSTNGLSVCNGIPFITYSVGDEASARMFVNNSWTDLGVISENDVQGSVIKSGTDGNIYIAYNNKLSSTPSDTKITVKKKIANGWQAVGPVNFSLSAGVTFDFQISHANQPYVLYMNGRVQKFDGSNWVYVGGTVYTGDIPSRLALDANDVPYIVYNETTNGHIVVKRLNGTTWEYVDQAGLASYTGSRLNILFDSSNTLYLGFVESNTKVHVKKLVNDAWVSVGPDFFTTGTNSVFDIAIDDVNTPYVAYDELKDSFRSKANVKKFNGTDWEFVGSPNFSATNISAIKIDFLINNIPMVAYSTYNGIYEITAKYFGDNNALDVSEHPLVNDEQKWKLTPNPVANTFSVVGNDEVQSLEIYDLTGKKVYSENANATNVDASFLGTGIYFVKIKSNSGVSTVKLLKN